MSVSATTVRHLTQWIVGHFAISCAICHAELEPEDAIQWDHIHAEVFAGPHVWDNLRPIHTSCHKLKSRADVQANAKIKRLAKGGRKRKGPAMKSKPFQKGSKPFPKRKK